MTTTAPPVPRPAASPPRRPRPGLGAKLWAARWPYAFLLPTAVFYGIWTVWPILASYWYSLVEWNGFEAQKTFVGLQNFRDVLADPLFWNSMKITFLFMVVTVPVRVVLALGAAVLLNHPRLPWARLFRTALFLPVVTTTAIIGVVMQFIFDPASGPVNLALTKVGLLDEPVNFLGAPETALWTVMAVHVWKWFGVTLVYWLAALQTVPKDLYEAATIDGAGGVRTFRHITLPLLTPFLVIITLITLVDTLRVFDLMLTMTGGGPFYSTEVVEIYVYRWAFAATIPQLGFASAAAVLFGIAAFAFALLQLWGGRAARKRAGELG